MGTQTQRTRVVFPYQAYTLGLCEVRLPPECSQAVPFVAQEDAAP